MKDNHFNSAAYLILRIQINVLRAILVFTGLSISQVSFAADKALLLGATKYAQPAYDLPGIDLDLLEMHKMALKLGFTSENIRVLSGEALNRKNVAASFQTFLTEGVEPADTILVYYSGHGLQITDENRDEIDGLDEALTTYELERKQVLENGQTKLTYDGIIADDEWEILLSSLSSERVFFIVDACHSGTVSRGIADPLEPDTRAYGDVPFYVKAIASAAKPATITTNTEIVTPGLVTISATQDDQRSWATKKGSLFTLALVESFEKKRFLTTPIDLVKRAGSLLRKRLKPESIFTPNLSGDKSLFTQLIEITSDASHQGAIAVNRQWFNELVASTNSIKLHVSESRVNLGEHQQLEIAIPEAGFINILSIDSNDAMVLLYPNNHHRSNFVGAGTVRFPGKLPFLWTALEPVGPNAIVALYSKEPVNLFASSMQKNQDGTPEIDFVLPSTSGLESYRKMLSSGEIRAELIEFTVCKNSSQC